MRKTTFFVTMATFFVLSLTGCGKKDSSEEQIALLRHEIAELKASMENETEIKAETVLPEAEETIENTDNVSEEKKTNVTSVTSSPITLSSQSSNHSIGAFTISCFYNNQFFSIEPKSTDSRDDYVKEPVVLPYTGNTPIRDVSFYLNGKSVTAVYQRNEKWEYLEDVDFMEVNGITCVPFHMKGAGNYFFEVVTSSGSYYFGVQY